MCPAPAPSFRIERIEKRSILSILLFWSPVPFLSTEIACCGSLSDLILPRNNNRIHCTNGQSWDSVQHSSCQADQIPATAAYSVTSRGALPDSRHGESF